MKPTNALNYLAGYYTLMNQTITKHGTPTDPDYGFKGTLIYTESGYMSALLHATRDALRPLTITYPDLLGVGDVSAWSLVGTYSVAYSGPATITSVIDKDGADKTVNATEDFDGDHVRVKKGVIQHGPLISTTIPQWLGTTQVRGFEVFDNTGKSGGGFVLKLTGEDPATGFRADLFWNRIG